MFILTSEIDQELVIGDNIRVVVLDVKGDQIKLGVEVPEDLSIGKSSSGQLCPDSQ